VALRRSITVTKSEARLDLAGFPPGAYLIGAQKAGTTTLAELLGGHPDLALSTPKEPNFYTGQWHRGLEWYRARFPATDKLVLLDASTSYSMAPVVPDPASLMDDVPRRIRELRPDARFIYILRDPVDRAISAYWHAVRNGDEDRDITECMTEDSMYLRGSRYAFQLKHYFECFGRERFLLLTTAEFATAPQAVLARCWSFLGLDPAKAPLLAVQRRNESYVVTGVLGSLLKRPAGKRVGKYVWKIMRRVFSDDVLRGIKSNLSRRPPSVSSEIRTELSERLSGEREHLKRLTGLELS
jgi:hypothetical protein